jgi:hypothetical protein
MSHDGDLRSAQQPRLDGMRHRTGSSVVGVIDARPVPLNPTDAPAGLARQIDACAHIKQRHA